VIISLFHWGFHVKLLGGFDLVHFSRVSVIIFSGSSADPTFFFLEAAPLALFPASHIRSVPLSAARVTTNDFTREKIKKTVREREAMKINQEPVVDVVRIHARTSISCFVCPPLPLRPFACCCTRAHVLTCTPEM
jgi:hypothetical protein